MWRPWCSQQAEWKQQTKIDSLTHTGLQSIFQCYLKLLVSVGSENFSLALENTIWLQTRIILNFSRISLNLWGFPTSLRTTCFTNGQSSRVWTTRERKNHTITTVLITVMLNFTAPAAFHFWTFPWERVMHYKDEKPIDMPATIGGYVLGFPISVLRAVVHILWWMIVEIIQKMQTQQKVYTLVHYYIYESWFSYQS